MSIASKLINCRTCNEKVAHDADVCQKCGASTAFKDGREVFGAIVFIAAVVIGFSLLGVW